MKQIDKSKRISIMIPEGTKIHQFFTRKNGNSSLSNWEILEQLISELPKTRADRANKIFCEAIQEITILYPETKDKWPLIKALVYSQLLGIEMNEHGYEESKKKRLDDITFEELKRL